MIDREAELKAAAEGRPANLDPWGGRKSRSQKKREAHSLLTIAQRLVEQKGNGLNTIPLSPALKAAVLDGQRLTKNARSRQFRLVAKMLRECDPDPIISALDGLVAMRREDVAAEQVNAGWRTRLLKEGAEGNANLTEFMNTFPGSDASELRSLIRQTHKGGEGARGVRARRDLLRLVRAIRRQAAGSGQEAQPAVEPNPDPAAPPAADANSAQVDP